MRPMNDRQTDSFNWDTNPPPPRLYFKPAPPHLSLLLDGRWLLSLREIKAGEEILLTKGWAFYQQADPVAASATEQ